MQKSRGFSLAQVAVSGVILFCFQLRAFRSQSAAGTAGTETENTTKANENEALFRSQGFGNGNERSREGAGSGHDVERIE